MISRSSKQDQRSAVGLVTGASIRDRIFDCEHDWQIAALFNALREEGWSGVEPEAGGGWDNLLGMGGENIAHICMGWAECIDACPAISTSRFLGQVLGNGR